MGCKRNILRITGWFVLDPAGTILHETTGFEYTPRGQVNKLDAGYSEVPGLAPAGARGQRSAEREVGHDPAGAQVPRAIAACRSCSQR